MAGERFNYGSFLLAVIIVALIIVLMGGEYFHVFGLYGLFEQFDYHHWLSAIGTTYIAVVTPIYYLVKRRYSNHYKTLVNIHMVGNLLAVLLISIHFALEIGRPLDEFPRLGTGVVLYAAVIALVGTGFLLRFREAKKSGRKSIRFVHTAVTLTFYFIIFVHILHGLNYI